MVDVFSLESRTSIVTAYNPGSGTAKLPVLKTPGAFSQRANPYATRCASRSWGVSPGWIRNDTGSPGISRKSTNIRTRTTMIVTTVWAARLIRNDRRPTDSPLAYHRPLRLQPSPASSGSTATRSAEGDVRARDLRPLPPPAPESDVDATGCARADSRPADQGERSGVRPGVALRRHVQHNDRHLRGAGHGTLRRRDRNRVRYI